MVLSSPETLFLVCGLFNMNFFIKGKGRFGFLSCSIMLPSVFCPLFVGIMSRFSISFVQDANDIIDIIIVAEILDCFMFLMVDTLVNFINKKILIVIKRNNASAIRQM